MMRTGSAAKDVTVINEQQLVKAYNGMQTVSSPCSLRVLLRSPNLGILKADPPAGGRFSAAAKLHGRPLTVCRAARRSLFLCWLASAGPMLASSAPGDHAHIPSFVQMLSDCVYRRCRCSFLCNPDLLC